MKDNIDTIHLVKTFTEKYQLAILLAIDFPQDTIKFCISEFVNIKIRTVNFDLMN